MPPRRDFPRDTQGITPLLLNYGSTYRRGYMKCNEMRIGYDMYNVGDNQFWCSTYSSLNCQSVFYLIWSVSLQYFLMCCTHSVHLLEYCLSQPVIFFGRVSTPIKFYIMCFETKESTDFLGSVVSSIIWYACS